MKYPLCRILTSLTLLGLLSNPGCLCAAPSVSPDPSKAAIPARSGAADCHRAGAAPFEPADKGRSSSSEPSCPHCQSVCAIAASLGERPSLTNAPGSICALHPSEVLQPIERELPLPASGADLSPPPRCRDVLSMTCALLI